jgi:hypothetical protein
MPLKLRISFDNLEIELGNEEQRSTVSTSFAHAAAPFVIDWLKRQGFTWWDRTDKPPAASSGPSSEQEAAAEGAHVVDGEPLNHASPAAEV